MRNQPRNHSSPAHSAALANAKRRLRAAAALLRDVPRPSDEDVAAAMDNLCRCGTYHGMKRGIKTAVELAGKEG